MTGKAPAMIAVVSGKGGTGKTTVSVNLALTAPFPVALLDCDVEEPNSSLTLRPEMEKTVPVTRPLPEIRVDRCTGCGACVEACRFNAVARTPSAPFVVPELCESCGACLRACPAGAIEESPQEVGTISEGRRGTIHFAQGTLHLGHTQGPTVIRALKRTAPLGRCTLLDGPPGASCPAVATLRGCAYALFVVEPTRFGLHDLEVVSKAARILGVPGGIVLNRARGGDGGLGPFAASLGLEILCSLPEEKRFAEAGLKGIPLVEAFPETRSFFLRLWDRLPVRAGVPT